MNVTKQFLDKQGKTRILVMDNKLTLYVEPSCIIKNEEVKCSELSDIQSYDDIPLIELSEAKKFMEEHNYEINRFRSEFDNVKGVFIDGEKIGFYIPLTPFNIGDIIDEYDVRFEPDPLLSFGNSKLSEEMRNMRIANLLKQYTLFEYSHRLNENRGDMSEDDFVIIGNHEYDVSKIGNKFERYNSHLYSNKKLIVPSKGTLERLLYFLPVMIINDIDFIKTYHKLTYIPNMYTTLFDFKDDHNERIFTSKNDLIEWSMSKPPNKVFDTERVGIKTAYLYRNPYISDKIMICQPVVNDIHNIKRAFNVARIWKEYKYNSGYYTRPASDQLYNDAWEEKKILIFSEKLKNPVESTHEYIILFGENTSALLPFEE